MTRSRPHALIVARDIGAQSQPWLWRQIVGFRELKPHVLTWSYENRHSFPLNGVPLQVLGSDPDPEQRRGYGRWPFLLTGMLTGNVYATRHPEKTEIARWLREIRPAVALCHFGFMGLRLLPVARSMNIPLVVHFHGLDLSSALRSRWYRWSLLQNLRKFAALVVVGSHQRRWLLDRNIPDDRIHLIPCGVPTEEFQPGARPADGPPRFIAVSRLSAGKGVDVSIRALARVVSEIPEAHLSVIGDGEQREVLEALVRSLDLQDRVTFHGNLPPRDVRASLSQADVFLQHSVVADNGWTEGFGVSIAEASASELPVVVTRSGGIPDQVVEGVTGLSVEEHDVAAMAQHMTRLARDPALRRRMGRAGRTHMIEHFDTRQQIRKLEDVLYQCVRSAESENRT